MKTANGRKLKDIRNERGFAYLAVLFALTLVGLSLAVTGQMWSDSVRREKEEDLLAKGTEIMLAINRYKIERGRYPKDLKILLGESVGVGVKRYLRKSYKDPMTAKGDWKLIKGEDGSLVGVSSKSKETPFKTVGFSEELKHLEGKQSYSQWVFRSEELPSGKVQNKSIK